MQFAGFWIRVLAFILDGVIVLIPLWLLSFMSGGAAAIGFEPFMKQLEQSTPIHLIIILYLFACLIIFGRTPGKALLKLRIVDVRSGDRPSALRLIVRHLGYVLSGCLNLGFLWVAFDQRKQGWHDKIAGTTVIRES